MKIAAKSLSVYNTSGEYTIGELHCGDRVLEIEENSSGVLVAYIVGLVKRADMEALVSPEKWEQSATKREKFIRYIANQQGALYVWGAQGQQMTPELIRKMEKSSADYKRALVHFNEHVKTGKTLISYDCSGLVVKFLLDEALISGDRSANGLYYNECVPIGRDELTAGDLVFKKYLANNQIYHVGVYMGDDTVVHAKGRDDGVVREPFKAAGWNRFGCLKCWGGSHMTVAYTRLLKNAGKPYIKGDDVRAVQRALEKKGYFTGDVDGAFGPETEQAVMVFQQAVRLTADGIVGPKTWAALIG